LAGKATPLHPEMRVILMSGYADDTLIAEGVKANSFLHKPFAAAELVRMVREVLDASRKDRTRGHSASR
jgi:DNA-binding NtrC family response regulator